MFYYILSHHFNGGFYRAEERARERLRLFSGLWFTVWINSAGFLLPAAIVLPDEMMANKSEVELHIGVCSWLRDKTSTLSWRSHIQCICFHLLCQSESCIRAGLALKWRDFNFLLFSPSLTECVKYILKLFINYRRYNKWIHDPILGLLSSGCWLFHANIPS